MSDRVKVAIVGSGPGGLSAAAHAAELGLSHLLLESSAHHANTIQRYQKGKHVMAEPNVLPLRSPLPFEAGTREAILSAWESGLGEHAVRVRYGAEVVGISGHTPDFRLELRSGETVQAEFVVLGIGVQGNLRKLGVPGEDLPFVQYQLDDPDEYRRETIVVVGAGDAAIENAVALAASNSVIVVNRRDEFARAKEGNLNLIMEAIEDERIRCFYKSSVARVEESDFKVAGDTTITLDFSAGETKPGIVTLNTESGEARIPCNRVIARLGAIPPRRFVESCGIEFPNESPVALPELTNHYESNVPGLYIVGALGGYPLIKQAMNQGYEVVEYLLGNEVEPADHPLLEARLSVIPGFRDVNETLAEMQRRIPIFATVNALLFRELMLDSDIVTPAQGQPVFRKNDYTDTFFTLFNGSVEVELGDTHKYTVALGAGQFFGEMSLLSGRRRSATVYAGADCVLIETPRRTMNKLINSNEGVKRVIDEQFIVRAIQTSFAPEASVEDLKTVARDLSIRQFRTGDVLFGEGDEADVLHLIRSGSVAVSRRLGGREVVLSYVASGNYVGEMGLVGNTRRMATVTATVPTETISLDKRAFNTLLETNPKLRDKVQRTVRDRLEQNARMEAQPDSGDIISFLMQQGLGEATDVLLIDSSLCIGCDNCEKACAETHDGTSRLDREAGPTFASVHVPTSCRHCENPHCMKDCPPDAIRRAPNGEVFIMDNCIGCGNCERNCPYDVIQMASKPAPKPPLWQWLLFGAGPGPGQAPVAKQSDSAKKAVKCDMCMDLPGGPACVRACPTGAAIRISPEQFVDMVNRP